MCGIAGFISSSPLELSIIHSMTNALLHRGPDASGIYCNEASSLALGHTRLSIIDVSEAANQPFFSRSGRYVVVFNGEIYNFKTISTTLSKETGIEFKTTSDTEVVVEAFSIWGKRMVEKFEGMFAGAIADLKDKTVFLFRDRMGKKPLYYYSSNSLFAFASEIKSILRLPTIRNDKQINQGAIGDFLHMGYIPEPQTIYQNIYKFPAGHVAEIDNHLNFKPEPYWKISNGIKQPKVSSIDNATNHLHALLDDAVEKRLISDVPLGTFLSGGTDSSLVTALASKHVAGPLKTFSIGFKESKFNESIYAQNVSSHLRTHHTEYMLSENEAVDLLETYLQHFDEPFADTSAIPTMLVSKLARKQVTVALTGDGGDELFQGYGAYAWADRLNSLPWKLFRTPLRTFLQATGNSRLQRISHLLESPEGNLRSHIFSQEQYLFTQLEIRKKLLRYPDHLHPFFYDESIFSDHQFTEGEKQALFDLQYYLKDDLLVKLDRASMYYGLECRSPLLDYRIVEYSLSLASSLKKRDGKSKWLLKEILRRYLPNKAVDRPKWGFSIPLGIWMKTHLRYLMDDFLNPEIIQEANLVNYAYVHKLKTDFLQGKNYLYNRLWVIIVLHKWWKQNIR